MGIYHLQRSRARRRMKTEKNFRMSLQHEYVVVVFVVMCVLLSDTFLLVAVR